MGIGEMVGHGRKRTKRRL